MYLLLCSVVFGNVRVVDYIMGSVSVYGSGSVGWGDFRIGRVSITGHVSLLVCRCC